MKNWTNAEYVTITSADIYTKIGVAVVANVPSFLRIVGFRPPSHGELYITIFGSVTIHNENPEENKPRFVLELAAIKGKVLCPHCHYDATLDSWAPGTDYVGCPCGWSVAKMVSHLWCDQLGLGLDSC